MLDTFQLNRPEDQKLVIPCLLTLNRLEVCNWLTISDFKLTLYFVHSTTKSFLHISWGNRRRRDLCYCNLG